LFQVALASDICTDVDDCNIDTAGILCIIASILWAGAGCTTLALKKRPDPVFNAPARVNEGHATAIPVTPIAAEVTTKTMSPDGTLTTTHTTTITNPDGSKSVSVTTTEVAPDTTDTNPDGSEIVSEIAEVTPRVTVTNPGGSKIGS
jgi:hypothetical protein